MWDGHDGAWFLSARLRGEKEAPYPFLVDVGRRGEAQRGAECGSISDLGSRPSVPGRETIQGLKTGSFLKHTSALPLSPGGGLVTPPTQEEKPQTPPDQGADQEGARARRGGGGSEAGTFFTGAPAVSPGRPSGLPSVGTRWPKMEQWAMLLWRGALGLLAALPPGAYSFVNPFCNHKSEVRGR